MRKASKKRICSMIILIILLFTMSGINSWAAEKKVDSDSDIESNMDSFFNEKMEEYNIPGAAVVVVKEGKVVFQKAYGYADAESKIKFDTDKTTFRIASITKVFTASALMQLVEEGKVELNENIRTYLPNLKINNPYDKPVTVENLLTHTSGIDSSVLMELSYDKLSMPCGYLLNEMNQKNLKVVKEPGSNIEYCSYGVVLQGCIIEAISGMSCKDYINENIIKPLGMNQTVMAMEEDNLTSGYNYFNGKLTKSTLEGAFKLYPVGGLISSISDMADFMKMYLNGGSYNGQRVFSETTVKDILTTHETYDKILPGMCYGFGEFREQGVRVVGHGGYSPDGLLSQLDLYPQNNTGTFVIVNQGSNNNITDEFRSFFVSYLNLKDKKLKDMSLKNMNQKESEENDDEKESNASSDSINVSGTYRFSDYSKTTLCKGDAFGGVGEVTIKQLNGDKIKISGRDDYTGKSYTVTALKRESLQYQIEDSDDYLVFHAQGKRIDSMAMTDTSWHGYYEKLSWYETSCVQMPVFIAGLLLYVFSFFAVIIRELKRVVWKRLGKQYEKVNSWNKIRYALLASISFMYGGFYVYSLFSWGMRLRYSIPIDVKINLMMPIVGTLGVVLFAVSVIYEWFKRKGKVRSRIFDTVFLCISLIFLFLFWYWNLLGFQY